ncbi:hypothetical protein F4W70_08440 [Pseudomonas cannabina]|nr:hypothetical protein F4W70_08440 [Pseudomonas cannabina]
MSAMGCEAALKPATSAVSGTPRRLVLLPVPGSSRTSPLPHVSYRGQANKISRTSKASPGPRLHPEHRNSGFCPQGVGADRATLRLSAMCCEAALKPERAP